MVIITPTEMVGVIGFLANPFKWVFIECKVEKNLATKKNLIIKISNT